MLVAIVILNVISAALPIMGIVRLLARASAEIRARRTQQAERGHTGYVLGDIDDVINRGLDEPYERMRALIWDVGLVGTGVVIGAVANIWSLFLP